MSSIGITGHQSIERRTAAAIKGMIQRRLRELQPVTGLSSLAAGADQMFARCVIDSGGQLVVILPSEHYEETLAGSSLRTFRRLQRRATRIVHLPYTMPSEEAYFAAGKRIVDMCDILFAVWDGNPAAGLGGTGDIVGYANDLGKPIEILWPSWGSR